MSDKRLREAERAAEDDPEAVLELEAERLRAGLGWAGEKLLDGLVPLPQERNVYVLTRVLSGVTFSTEVVHVTRGLADALEAEANSWKRILPEVGPFYIGKYPVTWLDCDSVVPRPVDRGEPDDFLPATDIQRAGIRRFLKATGLRLPTYHEWRRAAVGDPVAHGIECSRCLGAGRTAWPDRDCSRCTDTPGLMPRPYPWGAQLPDATRCASKRAEDRPHSHPVVERRIDSYRRVRELAGLPHAGPEEILAPTRPSGASPFGLQDAFGNVWEAVSYPGQDPREPAVAIGGPIHPQEDDSCIPTSIATNGRLPIELAREKLVGFRIALDAPGP